MEDLMKAWRKMGWRVFAAALIVIFTASAVIAGMAVFLKDGRVVNVPVNRDDIIGISFEEGAGPAGSFSGNITWDFESGDLRGWHATGTAFSTQPTYGDNPTARHRGQPSQHQGNYWVGGYENRHTPSEPAGRIQGDGPQGTLTSDPFTINFGAINFLIGGGCDINTERVELLVDGQVVYRATGKCTETMHRVRWNVSQYRGRTAQVRLVDSSSGGWGHINFDDVKFEAAY
jgi:hypothetical protein